MRSHPVYLTFQRRWQLPVYFQLRWKDIVGKLEEALSSKSDASIDFTRGDNYPVVSRSCYPVKLVLDATSPVFTTSQAAAVYEAIRTAWHQDVCIPEIGHRFWRLTLQVC